MKNNELPTLINSACIILGDAIEKYYRGTSPQVDYYQFVRLVLIHAWQSTRIGGLDTFAPNKGTNMNDNAKIATKLSCRMT